MAQLRSKTQVRPSAKRSPPGRARLKRAGPAARPNLSAHARRCRTKFLHYFPKGFYDSTYLDWERDYKLTAHTRWQAGPEGLAAGTVAVKLSLAPNTLSFHLDRLRQAQLVSAQREGRSLIYTTL